MDIFIGSSGFLKFQKSAASNIRRVTSTALEVLNSAGVVIKSERGSDCVSEPGAKNVSTTEDQKVEPPKLTYQEFEKLYKMGKINRHQLRTGKVGHQELLMLKEILDNEDLADKRTSPLSHDLVVPEDGQVSIDCGLKRVDSKRYKRDYVINRSPKLSRKKWDVTEPSPEGTSIVKGTPAGKRENADELEDEVSLNS